MGNGAEGAERSGGLGALAAKSLGRGAPSRKYSASIASVEEELTQPLRLHRLQPPPPAGDQLLLACTARRTRRITEARTFTPPSTSIHIPSLSLQLPHHRQSTIAKGRDPLARAPPPNTRAADTEVRIAHRRIITTPTTPTSNHLDVDDTARPRLVAALSPLLAIAHLRATSFSRNLSLALLRLHFLTTTPSLPSHRPRLLARSPQLQSSGCNPQAFHPPSRRRVLHALREIWPFRRKVQYSGRVP